MFARKTPGLASTIPIPRPQANANADGAHKGNAKRLPSQHDKGAIRFEIQSVLWGSPGPDSVRADRVQIVRILRGEPGNWILGEDQSYVAYIPRQEPAVVALESIDEDGSSRLSTLRTIADLHTRPEGAPLAAAAYSADPLVARYAPRTPVGHCGQGR